MRFSKLMFLSAVMTLTCAFASACTTSHQANDLAVSKLSQAEIQAASFLALNDDQPGTPVDIRRYLTQGKYTVLVYYSPYSAPSMTYVNLLKQLCQTRPDIAVRTLNVNRPDAQDVDWQSPIMLADRVGSLPYFCIFDPRGALRAHGRPAYEQIVQWTGYKMY